MIAGADGCKAGWLVAMAENWPCLDSPHLFVCRDFRGLLELSRCCRAVAVDIPIGLPEGGETRRCDLEARKKLGREGQARVFLTPPRESLEAKDPKAFQAKCRNLRGRGVGLPVWGIVPKLRDVDKVMRPELQHVVCEFHPELVWQRLAGNTLASKHSREGIDQRCKILKREARWLNRVLQWRKDTGKAASLDDILDAVVGLAAAQDFLQQRSQDRRLPRNRSPRDSHGLRMEIWF